MQTRPGNKSLVARLAITAVAMFGFGFALVPLYDIFCEVTGIRIPIRATEAATITEQTVAGREIHLELLANTNNNAPWEFRPAHDKLDVSIGRLHDTQYIASNLTDQAITGVATPDVRPAEAGRYLRKVECFCFNEQEFAAGETRELGVRFFIEPDLPKHIETITLSYTFFVKPENFATNN